MKTVRGKRMCRLLEARGWTRARVRGSHYTDSIPGRPNIIVPVHANSDLNRKTQKTIMRQAGLNDADL